MVRAKIAKTNGAMKTFEELAKGSPPTPRESGKLGGRGNRGAFGRGQSATAAGDGSGQAASLAQAIEASAGSASGAPSDVLFDRQEGLPRELQAMAEAAATAMPGQALTAA